MATFFSGKIIGFWAQADNYMYGTLTGNVSRSGNTVTLSGMWLAVSFRYSAWGSGSYTFKVNGTNTTWTMDASSPSHAINNTSFSVSATQTSATVSWVGSDGYSGSFDVTFPSGYVAPTKPTISATSVNYSNSLNITYGTTSFGVPSSGTVYLYGGTSASPTTQIATKTTTGNTTYSYTGLSYNRKYYFRSRAGNGSGYSDYTSDVTATTVPPDLTGMTVNSQTYTAYNKVSVTVTFTKPSDSGALTETLWYKWQVQGTSYGSDINGGTISGTSKQVTITGVPTGSRIAVYAWVKTTAGQNTGKLYYFDSSTTHTAPNFSNFTYEDTNTSAVHITGNNQTMIQGISDPKITISTANKATGNNGIAVSNYSFSFSGRSDTATWSSSSAVTKTLGKPTTSGTQTMTVSAVDALSLSKAVNKSVTVYPWSAPTVTATATRLNNFENDTTIHIVGTWSPVTISGVNKNTMEVKYRYKQSTTTTWGSWITLSASHDTANWTTQDFVLNLDNNYSWNLEAYVGDYFTSKTTSITIPAGQPQFFIGADGRCSVGGKPNISKTTGENGLLQVNGRAFANGNRLAELPITVDEIDMASLNSTLRGGDYSFMGSYSRGNTGDCNNFVESGFHRCYVGTRNLPSSDYSYWSILVFYYGLADRFVQIAFGCSDSSTVGKGALYWRTAYHNYNGSDRKFLPWVKISDQST